MDPKYLLRQLIVGPSTTHEKRLRSRHPFATAVCKLLNELSQLSIHAATMIINGRLRTLKVNQNYAFLYLGPVPVSPLGTDLPRPARVRLNRLCPHLLHRYTLCPATRFAKATRVYQQVSQYKAVV